MNITHEIKREIENKIFTLLRVGELKINHILIPVIVLPHSAKRNILRKIWEKVEEEKDLIRERIRKFLKEFYK
ncbi:hypothetical protein ES705_15646 [subsurface metagenome]